MKPIIRLTAFAATIAFANAQTVHLVGPGGFAQVNEAVAAAASGDIIAVQAGSYDLFHLTKGLTLRQAGPGTVSFVGAVFTIPAGEVATVTGLNLPSCRVWGGRVVFEECTIHDEGNAVFTTNGTVHLIRCHLEGSPSPPFLTHTLRAANSDVTAIDTTITHAQLLPWVFTPTHAVHLDDSRLHGSNLTVLNQTGAATLAASNSTAWLTDSTFATSVDCTNSNIQIARTTIGSSPCITTVPNLVGVSQPQPITPGAPFALNYTAEPNAFVLVFAGPRPGTVDWGPFLAQPSWLDEQVSFSAALTVADANGHALVSWNIPANPGISDQQLYFKGISGLALPLQASPLAGGVAR